MGDQQPTMRDMFRHHHKFTEADREAIWKDCVFVLDTNVLLNIYRYADANRQRLFDVLDALRGRIWIPHQVALEFYKRRLGVIVEQRKKYEEAIKAIEGAMASIGDNAFKKSAFLDLETVRGVLKPAIESATRALR